MKGELEGSFYVALEGAPTTFFQGALKIAGKGEENDTFDLVTHGLLESTPKDALNDQHKDPQGATITFESKKNFANILNFQQLLIILTSRRCNPLAEDLWVEGRVVKTAVKHEYGEQIKAGRNQRYL